MLRASRNTCHLFSKVRHDSSLWMCTHYEVQKETSGFFHLQQNIITKEPSESGQRCWNWNTMLTIFNKMHELGSVSNQPVSIHYICLWKGVKMSSHVSQLRLSPHQHISYPLDFEQLTLNVIHSDGGVCHGHNVVFIWGRNWGISKSMEPKDLHNT